MDQRGNIPKSHQPQNVVNVVPILLRTKPDNPPESLLEYSERIDNDIEEYPPRLLDLSPLLSCLYCQSKIIIYVITGHGTTYPEIFFNSTLYAEPEVQTHRKELRFRTRR